MCLHISWFHTYQSVDDGIVYMGNNVTCKTVGIGSIRIKMYDGIVRTLTDVRHVLELRKNLISMGVLDDVGYKFAVQGGVMKISKGILVVMKANRVGNLYKLSMGVLDNAGYKFLVQGGVMKISKGILVVMKAHKVGNLYELEGRTKIDHATIASDATDSTLLWHQCLGHMSERGMKVLADRKLLLSLKFFKFESM